MPNVAAEQMGILCCSQCAEDWLARLFKERTANLKRIKRRSQLLTRSKNKWLLYFVFEISKMWTGWMVP